MLYNSKGQAVHGVGTGDVCIDNSLIDKGGACAWLDDDMIIYQHISSDGIYLKAYSVSSGQYLNLLDGNGNYFQVNDLSAGGNVFAGFLDGQGLTIVGIGSFLHSDAKAGRAFVSSDGLIAYVADYQNGTPWLLAKIEGNGLKQLGVLSNEYIIDLHLLSEGRALWQDGHNKVQVYHLPQPEVLSKEIYRPRACIINKRIWICYWSNELNLVLHPFDSTSGYIVHSYPNAYNHDIVCLEKEGIVRVGFCTNQGESQGSYEYIDIGIDDPTYDLKRILASPIISNPVPPLPSSPPPTPEVNMNAPNHLDVVERVRSQHRELAVGDDPVKLGQLTEFVLDELVRIDPYFGALSKSPGENQYNGHAADAVCYKVGEEVYDIFTSKGEASWDFKTRRENNHWTEWKVRDVIVDKSEGGGNTSNPPDTSTQGAPPLSTNFDTSKIEALLNQVIENQKAEQDLLRQFKNELIGAIHDFGKTLPSIITNSNIGGILGTVLKKQK